MNADDHFYPVMALASEVQSRLHELFPGIFEQPESYISRHGRAVTAEESPDRLVEMFSLQVPERYIHGAHGRGPDPGLSPRIKAVEKIVPVAFRRQRILTHEERGNFFSDQFSDGKPLSWPGQAVSGDADIRVNPHKHDFTKDRFF